MKFLCSHLQSAVPRVGLLVLAIGLGPWPSGGVYAADVTERMSGPARQSAPMTSLYFENDTFADQDRHYTNGVKLSWLSADLATWGQEGWRKRVVEALPFVNRPGAQKNLGVAFGQNIYTPQDISLVPPDPTDRPYAGWTYFEFSFSSKTRSVMDTLSFQLGIVGPHSYADELQRLAHEWLNDERPQGWDYQLEDEPGVNIIFERKTRFYAATAGNLLGVDLVPHIGVSLGNIQTYVNAGASARIGFNLPSDFGVDLIRGGGGNNNPVDGDDPRLRGGLSLFAFGGVDGRAVARDIFLDGNTFTSGGPQVDKKHFVGDAFFGVGLVWSRWQLSYAEVVRGREFKGQDRLNRFGSVTLSVTW